MEKRGNVIRQMREFSRSSYRALLRVIRFELRVRNARADEQHRGIGAGGETRDVGMLFDSPAQNLSPVIGIEQGGQIGRPLPETEKSLGSVRF